MENIISEEENLCWYLLAAHNMNFKQRKISFTNAQNWKVARKCNIGNLSAISDIFNFRLSVGKSIRKKNSKRNYYVAQLIMSWSRYEFLVCALLFFVKFSMQLIIHSFCLHVLEWGNFVYKYNLQSTYCGKEGRIKKKTWHE